MEFNSGFKGLTTHCIAVQRSRISGTVPPPAQYVFTACKEKN